MEPKRFALLLLLLTTGSYVISGRTNYIFDNTNINNQSSSTMHHVSMDCGDPTALKKIVAQCLHDLERVANYGYPWFLYGSNRMVRNYGNGSNRNTSLRDAMDSLNQVCYIQDRCQTCLEESGLPGYCTNTIAAGGGGRLLQLTFQFICHDQRRDENLVRSLQCLHDTRVLAMLYFHIADRCRGIGILDEVMSRVKNAYFYNLEINIYWESTHPPVLYCMPKSVISTCIRGIVEDHCGSMTADLVQSLIAYHQDWYSKAMESAGLISDICDRSIAADTMYSMPPIPARLTKLGISRLLEITAPGTALDTIYGKMQLAYLRNLSEEELCSTQNAVVAYQACWMSSDDKTEKSKFNILQFANQVFEFAYHGTQCSRLEQFTACWNLLQEICGPKVQGLEQHATLLVEGCKIQSEMDTIGCHWQDMLLPHYIWAGRVTVWPMVIQCLYDLVYLDAGQYSRFNGLMNDLDTVILLLQPGVEDISRICGSPAANRVKALLQKLRYVQRDALKYTMLLEGIISPH